MQARASVRQAREGARAFRDGFVLSAGEGSDGGSLLDLSPQLANLVGAQLARLMGGDVFRSVDDFLKIVAFEQEPPAEDAPRLKQEWRRMAKNVFAMFEMVARNWTPRLCADFVDVGDGATRRAARRRPLDHHTPRAHRHQGRPVH